MRLEEQEYREHATIYNFMGGSNMAVTTSISAALSRRVPVRRQRHSIAYTGDYC